MPQRATVRTFRFRGLTVVYEPLPGPITAIAINVRAGARYDGATPGLAHMAEHMLFQGTDALDQLALNRRAAEIGGSHNATTGYESIALTIEVFNEDFASAIELLSDQFYRSRVDPQRFRKECRVVLDEIRGFRDDPLDHLHERGWSTFFGAPIGHPICGTVGSVRAMEPGDVTRFLRRRFVNANAVLAVVGGVSEQQLRKALSRHVAADRVGEPARSNGARRGRGGVLRLPGSERGQSFVVRFLEVDPSPRNLLALGVALDLVGADPDSTLFQVVRERHGLGYEVSAELEWGRGWGAAVLSASAGPGRAERLARIIDDVLQRSAQEGFAPADLARARKKRRYGYAVLAERRLDRALARADCVASGFPSLEESQRVVASLDDAEIHQAWRRAVAGRSLLAVLGD
ncbi:MAG: pitrilysin family protein, partial [Thermodesulfobacteriota bacterium]